MQNKYFFVYIENVLEEILGLSEYENRNSN